MVLDFAEREKLVEAVVEEQKQDLMALLELVQGERWRKRAGGKDVGAADEIFDGFDWFTSERIQSIP